MPLNTTLAPRWPATGLALTALVALVALVALSVVSCSKSTSGSGAGAPSSPASVSTSTTPSASVTSQTPIPSPTSSVPQAAPSPSICAGGKCTVSSSASFGTSVVDLLSGPSPSAGIGSTVIELVQESVPVFWKTIDEESPLSVTCSAVPQPNCVVVDATGAHASVFHGFVVGTASMTEFGSSDSDTPATTAKDLNGDGWIDVVTEQDTYMPTFATGTVYWQTFRSDGQHLTSTGCTTPTHAISPVPTTLLTGACPAS